MAAAAGLGGVLPAGGAVRLERSGVHPHQRQTARVGGGQRPSVFDQPLWPDV